MIDSGIGCMVVITPFTFVEANISTKENPVAGCKGWQQGCQGVSSHFL
jgi:hypothetical protein